MKKNKLKILVAFIGFFIAIFSVYCIFEVNIPQWKYYFAIKNVGDELLMIKYEGIGFFNSLIFPSIQTLLLLLTGTVMSIKSFPSFSSYLINRVAAVKNKIKAIKRNLNNKRVEKLKAKIEKMESDE